MADVSDLIRERVRKAAEVLSRSMRVRAVYLFGSQSEGTADDNSDIDLAAFVDGAAQLDIRQRAEVAADVQLEVGSDIEVHIFPAEFLTRPRKASFAAYVQTRGIRM